MAILTTEDAVDVWLARWKQETIQSLCSRFQIDPRRAYEIWKEEKFVGSRLLALERLRSEAPSVAARVNTSPHVERFHVVRRDPYQPDLFD